MPTLRRTVRVLIFPAIAWLGAACERADTPTEAALHPATELLADGSTPVNYISVNFGPILSTASFNYDWSTGEMTEGTATASVSSTANALVALISDPTPPDPNGFGTFIGTAHPERFSDETVVFTQSACPGGPGVCFADNTFTFGYMVMYNTRGKTLDQLTTLATMYYVENGDCGAGSPRFSVVMSNGAEVHVYIGPFPQYTLCMSGSWQSTGNLVTDPEPRWDSTQLGGTFYGTYSEAVTLAAAQGLTINSIFLGVDSGWYGTNPLTTQTILFKSIQANGVTRFPK